MLYKKRKLEEKLFQAEEVRLRA